MNKNYVVVSRFTNKEGFVTKITNTKIYVTFINDFEHGIGLSLKEFKRMLIVNEDDLNEIISIRNEKRLERKLELEKQKMQNSKKVNDNNMLPNLSKEGYIFEGWYDSPTFEHRIYRINKNMLKSGFELYPKWTPIEETETI